MQSEFANVVFRVIAVLDEFHRDRVIARSVARIGYELESGVEHDDVIAQKRLACIKQVLERSARMAYAIHITLPSIVPIEDIEEPVENGHRGQAVAYRERYPVRRTRRGIERSRPNKNRECTLLAYCRNGFHLIAYVKSLIPNIVSGNEKPHVGEARIAFERPNNPPARFHLMLDDVQRDAQIGRPLLHCFDGTVLEKRVEPPPTFIHALPFNMKSK